MQPGDHSVNICMMTCSGLALVLVILSSLVVLSSSSEARVQHTSVSISVSRVTMWVFIVSK